MTALLLGEFALLVADKVSNVSKPAENWVYGLGKWMPGATGSGPDGSIGPYSGKETIGLAIWLSSWAILHMAFKHRSFRIARSLRIFLIAGAVITLNFLEPIADVTFGFVGWFAK